MMALPPELAGGSKSITICESVAVSSVATGAPGTDAVIVSERVTCAAAL